MESPRKPERRSFLQQLGTLTGGSLMAAQMPALLATLDLACTAEVRGEPYRLFTPEDAAFVEAFAARIIPTDDRPGATEAGVVRFIDMVFDTMPNFTGAEQLIRETASAFASSAGADFASLDPEAQDELIAGDEGSLTFGVLQFLTLAGFLAHPDRGGNRDKVGWDLIGFDDRHAWAPPFGYYDAEANR